VRGAWRVGDAMLAARGEKEQKDSGRPQNRQQEAALRSFKLDERSGQEHQQL